MINWYQKATKPPFEFRMAMMDEDDFLEMLFEAPGRVLEQYRHRGAGESQTWQTVPVGVIQRIWNQHAQGFIPESSEKFIDRIAEKFMWNVAQLYGNTVLCGHTMEDPDEIAELWGLDPLTEEDYAEGIDEFMYHEGHGNICISDYALDPLIKDCAQLSQADTPEEKIVILDRMINRIHMRGDIASLFVEGGVPSLDELSESPEERAKRMWEESSRY